MLHIVEKNPTQEKIKELKLKYPSLDTIVYKKENCLVMDSRDYEIYCLEFITESKKQYSNKINIIS